MKKSTREKTSEKIRRRAFLKGAAVAGVALGAASTRSLADQDPAAATPAETENRGYRETTHVREYYRLARF